MSNITLYQLAGNYLQLAERLSAMDLDAEGLRQMGGEAA